MGHRDPAPVDLTMAGHERVGATISRSSPSEAATSGKIETSRQPGQGARFTIFLPCAERAAALNAAEV